MNYQPKLPPLNERFPAKRQPRRLEFSPTYTEAIGCLHRLERLAASEQPPTALTETILYDIRQTLGQKQPLVTCSPDVPF
jgi:hypothetical protein